MLDTYTSERLLQEFPRPLLNFLWYVWHTYYDPSESEFRVTLQNSGDASSQQFLIHSAGVNVTQNFGCSIDAEIVVRKDGTRYFMEYY